LLDVQTSAMKLYNCYRAALNAGRSSQEKGVLCLSVYPPVRPSVCPSVKRVYCDKTEKNLFRFLYHTKDHLI